MSIPILDPEAGRGGSHTLHERIRNEPKHRISEAQRQSMIAIALRDPRAKMEGLDWKFRPVIYGRSSGPNGPTRYALQKNGTATPVHYANGRSTKLAEVWK